MMILIAYLSKQVADLYTIFDTVNQVRTNLQNQIRKSGNLRIERNDPPGHIKKSGYRSKNRV
jgi:hypothetical protein